MANADTDSRNNNGTGEKIGNSASFRRNLIDTAVQFLSNKTLLTQDPELLKQFLIRKGLTEEEVAIAFKHFEASKNQSLVSRLIVPPAPAQKYGLLDIPQPPVPLMGHIVQSIVTTATCIGGILYALNWLWKTYMSSYFFGRNPRKKPVDTLLRELEAAVGSCIVDIKNIRSSLDVLTSQKAAELTRMQEVKSEINSLKTLLLNRNQFPATPTSQKTVPLSIPIWQLGDNESAHLDDEGEQEAEEEVSGSLETTNGSIWTF